MRYKVRFAAEADMIAALRQETSLVDVPVAHWKRRYIAIQCRSTAPRDAEAFGRTLDQFIRTYDAEVVEDYQYVNDDFQSPDYDTFASSMRLPDNPTAPSLQEVRERINVLEAWEQSRGKGVVIAIVDEGVCRARPDFQTERMQEGPTGLTSAPWIDPKGHGTMCACIAAASSVTGGQFDGIAPEARLMSCASNLYDSELVDIFDRLAQMAKQRQFPLVVSNSWGFKLGQAPPDNLESDVELALEGLISAGAIVVFSAGNNHGLANGQARECHPNTIWRYKSRSDLLVAGACDLEDRMWDYSSRGPGQHFGQPGSNNKPDCIAPTPRGGRIAIGDKIFCMRDGWGTSGACPQVAGLCALILSLRPNLGQAAVADAIRTACRRLPGYSQACQGAGVIDCGGTLRAII